MQETHATALLRDNMGSLTERVGGTEKQISALSDRMETLQRDTTSQFANLANQVAQQFGAITDKIDRQGAAFADARAPNWNAIIANVIGILTLGAGLFFAFIAPTNRQVEQVADLLNKMRETAVSHVDFDKYRDETHEWGVSLRDRLRADEDNAVSQRQVKELAERMDERDAVRAAGFSTMDARLQTQIDDLRHSSISREEMQADAHRVDDRLTAIVNSLSDVRRSYTDVISQALMKLAPSH